MRILFLFLFFLIEQGLMANDDNPYGVTEKHRVVANRFFDSIRGEDAPSKAAVVKKLTCEWDEKFAIFYDSDFWERIQAFDLRSLGDTQIRRDMGAMCLDSLEDFLSFRSLMLWAIDPKGDSPDYTNEWLPFRADGVPSEERVMSVDIFNKLWEMKREADKQHE